MPAATHIYHNGTILTMDSRASTASCLAVRGDRIAAVGGPDDVAPLRGPDTRLVDLKGRTMLPGFYDCHSHICVRACITPCIWTPLPRPSAV